MSLLAEAMTECAFLEKTREPDGEGGYITNWTQGAKFDAAITYDTSIEARTAEAQGVKSLYTVTTRKNVVLEYHDVFIRASDSKVFRVTSDGDDKYTPASAGLNMRQVTAEEWSVTG
jgi:hypothetical protein